MTAEPIASCAVDDRQPPIPDAAARSMWDRDGVRWGLFGASESRLATRRTSWIDGGRDLGAGTALPVLHGTRPAGAPIAADLSQEQLATARRCRRRRGSCFP